MALVQSPSDTIKQGRNLGLVVRWPPIVTQQAQLHGFSVRRSLNSNYPRESFALKSTGVLLKTNETFTIGQQLI